MQAATYGHEHHTHENGDQQAAPVEIRTDVSALNPSLIQKWVEYRQMTVPQWDNDSKSCKHCREKTKRGRRHNCRLCGFVFCSECTSKYHLPPQFRRKGKRLKEGITRVCFTCRDECLEVRKQVKNQEIILRPGLQKKIDNGITAIGVPQWQEIELTRECVDCLTPFTGKKNGTHHCRICGHLFCPLCTIKMDIPLPSRFRKKGKSGSSRVCLECRYLYFAGIRLDGGDGDTYDSADAAKMRQQARLESPSFSNGPQRSQTSGNEFTTGRESPASMSSTGPPPFMGGAPGGMPPPPRNASPSQQNRPGPPPFAGGPPQFGGPPPNGYSNGGAPQFGGPPSNGYSNGGPPQFGGPPPNGYSNGVMPNGVPPPPLNSMAAPMTPKFLNKPRATTPKFNRMSMGQPRTTLAAPRSMGSSGLTSARSNPGPGRGPPDFQVPTSSSYGPPTSTSYGPPPTSTSYGSLPGSSYGSPFSSNTSPPAFVNGGRPNMSAQQNGGPPTFSPYGNNAQQSTDQNPSQAPAWARNGIAPPGPHTHPPPPPHMSGGGVVSPAMPPAPHMSGGGPPIPSYLGGPPANLPPPPSSGGLPGPPAHGNRFGMARSMSASSHGSVDSLHAPGGNSGYNQFSPPQSPALNDRFARFQVNTNHPTPPPLNGPKPPAIGSMLRSTPPSSSPADTPRTGGGGGLLSELASGRSALRSPQTREIKKAPMPANNAKKGDMLNLLREKLNVRNAQVADDSDEEWSSSDG